MKKKLTLPRAGRRPSHGIWETLRGPGPKGHRLPANVTGEDDWEVEVPQIRMSRAFVVMLLLHLVAIGGLFAFHMFGKDDHDRERAGALAVNSKAKAPAPAPAPAPVTAPAPTPAETAARNAAAVASNASVPAAPVAAEDAAVPKARPVSEDDPEAAAAAVGHTGGHWEQYTIRKGDSRELIASTFGITVKELAAANPRASFQPLTAIAVPQFNKTITTPDVEHKSAGADVDLIEPSNTEYAARRSFAPNEEGAPEYEVAAAPATVIPEPVAEHAEAESAPLRPAVPRESATRQVASRDLPNREVRETERRPEPAKTVAKKEKSEKTEKPVKPSAGSRSHVVKKGDTVYNIARRYSISANDVMRANGVNGTAHIQLGQVLQIPVRR